MLFNSAAFFLFFPIVCWLYYSLPLKFKNPVLLVSSIFFYGYWNSSYLWLLMLSTGIDYYCGLKLGDEEDETRRKLYLWISIVGNLSILGTFKYYNFFASSVPLGLPYLSVVMPVGISFYTFQSMAYTIDVYRREIEPEKRFWMFTLFISFFPQLVAGPIERAKDLLPQFAHKKEFKDIDWEGAFKLAVMGYFKKMVIADRLSVYCDNIFTNPAAANSLATLIAFHFFMFQLYCDFSGYSDIARAVGKILGFELTINFHQPLWARNIKELLRNWHITLVTWLKSYVYFPLGGNRHGKWKTYRNIIVLLILSGLWHGSNWTYVVWGIIIGLGLIVVNAEILKLPRLLAVLVTFEFWTITTGMFFRSRSISDSFMMLRNVFSEWSLNLKFFIRAMNPMTYDLHFFSEFTMSVLLIIIFSWLDFRDRRNKIGNIECVMLLFFIIFFGRFNEKAFIYFHF